MYAAARLARDIGADAVVQCGDAWSVDLPNLDTPPFHVVRGNHEKWRVWAEGKFGKGIVGHADYTTFKLDKVKFGVIGGIDDTPKVRDLMDMGLDLGQEHDEIWFARLEGQQVRDAFAGVSVLLTHDAPFPFVLGHRPLPPMADYKGAGEVVRTEVVGSDYLNEVIRTVEPQYHFGGHMHLLCIRYIGKTRSYQLPPIDTIFQRRGYATLDTETMRVQYVDL